MLPTTMRAWVMEALGEPSALKLKTVTLPTPGPDEVLVEVSRVGVNYADGLGLRGRYQVRRDPPYTPGAELVGRVVTAGAGAEAFVGRRVMAQVDRGAAAEYCIVSTRRLRAVPDAVDDTSAAAIPIVFPTAHVALFHGRPLVSGEVVLILAAAGGVGSAAIQLAKRAGAQVVAAASSQDKLTLARDLGADLVLDYSKPDWLAPVRSRYGDLPLDVLVDPVGGARAEEAARLLRWRGRHAIVGFASGDFPKLAANRLLVRAVSAVGVYWSQDEDADLLDAIHADLRDAFASGACRSVIGALMELEHYPAAIEAVETGRTSGKVVLRVRD